MWDAAGVPDCAPQEAATWDLCGPYRAALTAEGGEAALVALRRPGSALGERQERLLLPVPATLLVRMQLQLGALPVVGLPKLRGCVTFAAGLL